MKKRMIVLRTCYLCYHIFPETSQKIYHFYSLRKSYRNKCLEYVLVLYVSVYSLGLHFRKTWSQPNTKALAASFILAMMMVADEARCQNTLALLFFSNFPRNKHDHVGHVFPRWSLLESKFCPSHLDSDVSLAQCVGRMSWQPHQVRVSFQIRMVKWHMYRWSGTCIKGVSPILALGWKVKIYIILPSHWTGLRSI